MKKILLVSLLLALFAPTFINAQCCFVHFDAATTGTSSSTFTFTTANPNEMIMISYDGWPNLGTGPIKVDGNPATQLQTAKNGNSGVAEVWYYTAPAAGAHNIVCTETGYSAPYYLNFAAGFYLTGGCAPLNNSNLTATTSTIPCVTGGTITNTITTTQTNAMIYCNAENNNGQGGSFPFTWTGATSLGDIHVGNGIEASHAYLNAPAPCSTYTMTAHNNANPNFGCGGLVMISVAIQPPPCNNAITITPVVTEPTCGQCNGSIFVGVVGGTGPYTYIWSPPVCTTNNATGLCAGTYTITVKDAACNTSIDSVTLTNGTLAVTANIVSNEPCGGQCVGIINANATGGNPPYTYAWTPLGGTNSSATGLCAGSYTITVHDALNCVVTATATITQPPPITVSVVWTNVKCNGAATGSATVTATGGSPNYTYSWAPVGGNGVTASNLSADIYTVTVKDANGCSMTATANITQPPALSETTTNTVATCGGNNGSATITVTGGTPGYLYAWTPLGGNGATASNLSAGVYNVTSTDANGCTITASISILNANSPTISIANVSIVSCFGGSDGSITTNTTGGTPPYTYSWAPAGGSTAIATGLSAGTYTITVHDAIGCISTASQLVTQPPVLTVGIGGIVNVACVGDSNGSAIATPGGGTPPYLYQWSPLGGNGAAGINFKVGIDTVKVTDGHGCTVTASVTITGNPSPVIIFSGYPLAGCGPNLCSNFTDLSTISAGFIQHWYWTFGDDSIDTLQNPRHCYDKSGFYSVSLKATASNGCTTTLSKLNMIDVYTTPTAAFSLNPQPATILDPVITFTDQSTDQYGIASWYWNYGDASDSIDTKQNPRHRYGDTGRYCATLMVTSKRGCVDTATECLVISQPFALYIPSGFSPNGDGINDIFLPRGVGIAQYSMYVFNRWGNMIFHSTDIDKGWTGTAGSSSTICQQDSYIYLIDVTDIFGKTHSYLGKVTLIQ